MIIHKLSCVCGPTLEHVEIEEEGKAPSGQAK